MSDSLRASPLPDLHELASACASYVKRAVGVELDGTPDTLPILDHYLLQLGSTEDGLTELIVQAAGAYLGEVVRANLPSFRWHLDAQDIDAWRLECEQVFLFFNPLGMVREAVARAEVPGSFAHLEVLPRDRNLLDESLDRMGSVREEDYFRLAVRFEVIEQVVLALEAGSVSRMPEGQVFSTATYEATARALREQSTLPASRLN